MALSNAEALENLIQAEETRLVEQIVDLVRPQYVKMTGCY